MAYKTDDPTHLAFNRSADSKLLRKKNYVAGGPVPTEDDAPLQEGEYPPENPTLNQRRQQMDHSDDPILELEQHRGLVKQQKPEKYLEIEETDGPDTKDI